MRLDFQGSQDSLPSGIIPACGASYWAQGHSSNYAASHSASQRSSSCFTEALVVCSAGRVPTSGHHPQHPPCSSPSKLDLSAITPEVIKLASAYVQSTVLNGSSLWARKGRTVFLVEVFQPIQRKYHTKSK